MIDYEENEAENEKNISYMQDINRNGHKCTNYIMCHSAMMVLCIKAQFMKKLSSNEAELKKALLIKKACNEITTLFPPLLKQVTLTILKLQQQPVRGFRKNSWPTKSCSAVQKFCSYNENAGKKNYKEVHI